jgi:hypothetical protein
VKRRSRTPGRPGGSFLSRIRIPPWLFYTIAALFAVGVFAVLFAGMLQPSAAR